MGEKRAKYRNLVGKIEEMRPLARHRIGWDNNKDVKMYLHEVGCGVMD